MMKDCEECGGTALRMCRNGMYPVAYLHDYTW